MASSGAPAAPYSFGVFLVSDLDTHLVIEGFSDDTVTSLKRKIEEEHALTFPEMGEIIVNAIKVESEGRLYRLANSVVIGRIITKSYLMLHTEIVPVHQNEQNIERLEDQISEAESIVLDKSQLSFESEDEEVEGSEDDSVHGEQMLCENQGESETNNQAEIETDNDSLCDHEEINRVSEANYEVASNVETKKEKSRERKDVEGDLGENKRRKKSQNTREIVPETEMDIDTDNESKEACETEKSTNNGSNEPFENQEKVNEGITESENPIPDFNQEMTESENPIPDSNQEIVETGNPIPEFNQEIMESENPIPDSNQGDKRKKKKSKQGGKKKKERSVIDTDEIIPESQSNEDIGNADVATDRVNPNQEPEPNQATTKAKSKSKKGSMNKNETSQDTTSALNGEPVVGSEGKKRRKNSKNQSKNASEFETLVLAASCQQENENNQVELDSNLVENEKPPKKDEKKKRKQEVGSTIESDEMNIETNQNENILETVQEKRKKKKRKQKVESIKESDEMVIETNQNENNLETVQEKKKKSSKKRGSKEKAAKLPEASSDKSEETLNPKGLDDLAFSNNISKDESVDVTPGSNVEKKRAASVLYLKRRLIWPRFLGAQVVTKRLKFLHHKRNSKKRIYSSK